MNLLWTPHNLASLGAPRAQKPISEMDSAMFLWSDSVGAYAPELDTAMRAKCIDGRGSVCTTTVRLCDGGPSKRRFCTGKRVDGVQQPRGSTLGLIAGTGTGVTVSVRLPSTESLTESGIR